LVALPNGSYTVSATVGSNKVSIDLVTRSITRIRLPGYGIQPTVIPECGGKGFPFLGMKADRPEEAFFTGPEAVGRIEKVIEYLLSLDDCLVCVG
jgi:hypothetical protein